MAFRSYLVFYLRLFPFESSKYLFDYLSLPPSSTLYTCQVPDLFNIEFLSLQQ